MFNDIKTVVLENLKNSKRLFRLAVYELKNQNGDTMFGILWNFLNPVLQIFVYWFVFAIGLKSGKDQGGYPYIIWMIVGIIPWFYISGTMNSSATSIHSFSGVLKRMNIPMAIVPIKSVLAAFISHIMALGVVFVVILMFGYNINLLFYQVLYFMLCSFCLLSAYALFSSAITVLFKDFQRIMTSVIRLIFYMSPVLWSHDRLSEELQIILKINPFAYIIDGYRNSILYGQSIASNWQQGCYFWIFTIILFVLGCRIHMRFRKKFIDLL